MGKSKNELTVLQIKAIQAIMNATDEEVEQAMRLFREYETKGESDERSAQRTNY